MVNETIQKMLTTAI